MGKNSKYYLETKRQKRNFDFSEAINSTITDELIAVEYVKGVSFCISYNVIKHLQEFEIAFSDLETESNFTDLMTIEANINAKEMPLFKPFQKLKKILGNGTVDFMVFAEYLTAENQKVPYLNKGGATFVIQDIFINKNWVPHEQLINICQKCKLKAAPIIYCGKYNEVVFNILANNSTSFLNKNTEKYGISVKLYLEKHNEIKRTAKLYLNDKFIKKIIKPKTISKEEIEAKVKKEVSKIFTKKAKKKVKVLINNTFSKLFIEKHTQKIEKKDFFPLIVSSIEKTFFSNFALNDLNQKKYKKALRKKILEILIKEFNINERLK